MTQRVTYVIFLRGTETNVVSWSKRNLKLIAPLLSKAGRTAGPNVNTHRRPMNRQVYKCSPITGTQLFAISSHRWMNLLAKSEGKRLQC